MKTNSGFKDFLLVLFNENEEVCVSPNKFGYYSIPLSALLNENPKIELTSQINGNPGKTYTFLKNSLQLIAINPIKGARNDNNVTAFRTFLVEIDEGTLNDQANYVISLEMPYSVAVFSGSKSIHFAITLDQDLPSKSEYAYYAQWLLNIVEKADQNTKNPSRSIRLPFVKRKETGKKQELLSNKGRVKFEDFLIFLNKYKDLAPKQKDDFRIFSIMSDERKKYLLENNMIVDLRALPLWAVQRIKMAREGTLKQNGYGRNSSVFAIAYELFMLGYDYDIVLMFMLENFPEEMDFKHEEIDRAVQSALKKVRWGLNAK